MKFIHQASPRFAIRERKYLSSALLLCGLVAGAVSSVAQTVIATPPPVSYVPAAMPQPPVSESALPTSWLPSPFQVGMVSLHPHISYRFLYGDGIQSSPGRQSKTSVHTISPGVLMNIGAHWVLDYTPTQTYYSDSAFRDTLDHSVSLSGGAAFQNWTLQVSQTFASSSAPLIETGRQANENSYGTTASAARRISDRTQLTTSVSHQSRFSVDSPDSRDWVGGEHVSYLISSRLDASLGVNFGYTDMSVGTDMTYTRPVAQLKWKATEKIALDVQGGFETRKFRSGNADNLNTPTFGASVQYKPFTTTTVSISANRGVSVSYFTNQVTRSTDWSFNLQQRLLGHYYLSAGYSGRKSAYITTDEAVPVDRDDQNYSFNLSLGTTVFQRATAAVFYTNTHNSSNNTGFGFNSSQIGLELAYRF